jgi:hypothetical protein
MFTVSCTSDKIWNLLDLVEFFVNHQNSSIELDIVPEAICLTNLGLYKLLDKFNFSQVIINTWNPLEKHYKYKIQYKGENFWFSRTANIDSTFHSWNLKKKFLCFYHRPTAGRLGLASYLFYNHTVDTLIHFSANEIVDFELDKLLEWDVDTVKFAGNLVSQLPLLLGGTDQYTKFNGYNYADPLTDLYRDILIDVVVESHVAGDTFFPTEKTIRPMLLKKPFIVFGSKNYLEHLRQMGFRTFADFWDEEYDGYDCGDRMKKIQALLDHLSKKSCQELETMYWDMQYSLEHNYNLLMTQKYTTSIKKIS